jgi:glycosyltransferase involved in cell wall biosynthesis
VDLASFSPLDKATARAALELPKDETLVGFIAQSLRAPIKGGPLVPKIFDELGNTSTTLLSAGLSEFPKKPRCKHIHLGWLDSPRLRRVFYAACDVLLCPSLADNFPSTVLEAMACGTPTVATPVGGLPEIVDDAVGWIADAADAPSMASALEKALSDTDAQGRQRTERCLDRASEQFAPELQAQRYLEVYESIARQ